MVDINKLQQNVPLHYNFIDVDIVSTNNKQTCISPISRILGYIDRMETFAWIHCSCIRYGGACILEHVEKKIRIYNAIFVPNQEQRSDCYPMILCTQIWQLSPDANTVSNIPTCSFLSEA